MATANEKETAFDHRDELHDADAAVQLAHDVDETVYSPWTFTMLRLYVALGVAYLCGQSPSIYPCAHNGWSSL
jgi:hypothetical protein